MVSTPNLKNLEFIYKDGAKLFELFAEPVKQEILPGLFINTWGYNGSTPGPTIIVNTGDNVILRVHNKLNEPTSIHWHGLIVPNSMDGVPEIEPTPYIQPGEYFDYNFKIVNPEGTYMYHSHVNSIKQNFMGLMGSFIIENSKPKSTFKVDRDYSLLLQEWSVKDIPVGTLPKGTFDLDPMNDKFNFFTINGKCFPFTEPLKCNYKDYIRVRFGNILMNHHPMHLHGHQFTVISSDGFPINKDMRIKKNTILVASGETWDILIYADNPGTWPLHCHMPHHMANNMTPNLGGMTTTLQYTK